MHAIYHDAAAATDDWLEAITLTGQRTAPPIGAVTGWLRDHTVGCAPTPQTALIRLRAVQAALFVHGILLRRQADALGADPARRLLGDLTPNIAARLHRICRTDAAAATALALHRAAIDATRHHATLSEQEAIVVLSVLRLETALNDLDAATYQPSKPR
ncbi:hypothetical protein PS9374_05501 [Planomonospora sphaerica]|uniref:Uncharacterized protein n=1 Tax=Planomonospora sphaerica TaxID=161355 RepID=A0A171DLP7_9ACTN|nr:hypothetical protein [Planomonospora sphaerica]GAT69821.1 hypothetical protein PS9374_05501 [Planomonospora sphaerica]